MFDWTDYVNLTDFAAMHQEVAAAWDEVKRTGLAYYLNPCSETRAAARAAMAIWSGASHALTQALKRSIARDP